MLNLQLIATDPTLIHYCSRRLCPAVARQLTRVLASVAVVMGVTRPFKKYRLELLLEKLRYF